VSPRTLVSFHAHPDDEALLTAGTLARAAAEGHRVVLVVATAGEAGLASADYSADLGAQRAAELDQSAAALGCARIVRLGYADSGMADAPTGHPNSFATADVEVAARRLADILVEESADVLTTYDPAGGYGHPDHIAVHRVGARAAELAATPVVLQATVDRRLLLRTLRALRVLSSVARLLRRASRPSRVSRVSVPPEFDPARFANAYTAPDGLTHRIDVRRYTGAKRAAMQAHASQASTDNPDFGTRTLALCLRLPGPVFRAAFGREWFIQADLGADKRPVRPLVHDVFAGVATRP
jgi:LmbE family N-acetylglucosaminyl deacetylase